MTESPLTPSDEERVLIVPEAEEHPITERPHHFLVQAPVPVMDVDGFNVTILGLVVFAISSVVCGVFYSDLQRDGNVWWLGVSVSGFGLGLIGLAYCLYRRGRRRAGRWDRD